MLDWIRNQEKNSTNGYYWDKLITFECGMWIIALYQC